jgi:hypothetical protein
MSGVLMSGNDEQMRKIELLERTVLEMGSELFQVKIALDRNQEVHEKFLAVLEGLKQLLDEKGIINIEDFESAVELGQAMETFNSYHEAANEAALERIKKQNH